MGVSCRHSTIRAIVKSLCKRMNQSLSDRFFVFLIPSLNITLNLILHRKVVERICVHVCNCDCNGFDYVPSAQIGDENVLSQYYYACDHNHPPVLNQTVGNCSMLSVYRQPNK